VVSIEGDSSTWRLFIDNGRVVQRRLQFLINNAVSENPVGLDEAISTLRSIQNRVEEDSEGSDIEDPGFNEQDKNVNIYDNQLGPPVKKILLKYLRPNKDKTSGISEDGDKSTAEALNKAKVNDLSLSMDHKLFEQDYDIQPKALFHVIYGESSPVFAYTTTALYDREGLNIGAWQVLPNGRLQREVKYRFKSLDVLNGHEFGGKRGEVVCVQRLERRDDNMLYIVSDRHNPWQLQYGDTFYIMYRVVISAIKKKRTRLTIWLNIEWINSSGLGKNVVEPLILRGCAGEAGVIGSRVSDCVNRLGSHPTAVAAIRLFGKLGTRYVERTQLEDHSSDDSESKKSENGTVLVPSRIFWTLLTMNTLLWIWSWIASILQNIIGVFILTGRYIWKNIALNKFLVLGLAVSSIFNVYLSARVGTAYWTERSAGRIVHQLGMIPDEQTVMRRSLYAGEIDDLINSGTIFSESPHQCYSKFRDIVYYSPFDDENLDFTDFEIASTFGNYLDDDSIAMADRVHRMRNNISFRRNELMVGLRVLNRMEKDAVFSEWRNFLVRELAMCNRGMRRLGEENKTSKHYHELTSYCNDCMEEWAKIRDKKSSISLGA
jgi:hypothetical protein